MRIVFRPGARLMAPLAVPEVTAVLLTWIVASASAAVGVTVRVVVVFGTTTV